MRDYISIGSVPAGEECAQLGSPGYREQSIKECRAFRHQLERCFPKAVFGIKIFEHDFGQYREVVAYYDDEQPNSEQTEQAFLAEATTPEYWDDEAKKELS